MAVNCDHLILSSDDEHGIPLISISNVNADSAPTELAFESDSSYEELARENAKNMDRLILETRLKNIEKDRRIAEGRNQKMKEHEDKQRKGYQQKKNFNDNSKNTKVDSNSVFNSTDPSNTHRNNYKVKNDGRCNQKGMMSKTNTSKNPWRPKAKGVNRSAISGPQNKKGDKVSNAIVEDPELISKLRNITLQEFDIDSTDTSDYESDNSSNNLSDNELMKTSTKLFTIRNLNRGAVMLDLDDDMEPTKEESEEEKKSKEIFTGMHYKSAEKSAAAQRRKKSNYLKKRYSSFKGEPNQTVKNVSDKVASTSSSIDDKSSHHYPVNDTELNELKNRQINKKPNKKKNYNNRSEEFKSTNNSSIEKNLGESSEIHLKQSYNRSNLLDNINKVNTETSEKGLLSTDLSLQSPSTSKNSKKTEEKNTKDVSPMKMQRNYERKIKNQNKSSNDEKPRKNDPKMLSYNESKPRGKKNDFSTKIKPDLINDGALNSSRKNTHKDNNQIERDQKKFDLLMKNNNQKVKINKKKIIKAESHNEPSSKTNNKRCPVNQRKHSEQSEDSDNSIVILKEVSLVKNQRKIDEDILVKSDSSDNEIGKSLYECSETEKFKLPLYSDSESEEIDFTTIISERKHNNKKSTEEVNINVTPIKHSPLKRHSGSSSDFEAEFNACLLNSKVNFQNSHVNK